MARGALAPGKLVRWAEIEHEVSVRLVDGHVMLEASRKPDPDVISALRECRAEIKEWLEVGEAHQAALRRVHARCESLPEPRPKPEWLEIVEFQAAIAGAEESGECDRMRAAIKFWEAGLSAWIDSARDP